MIDPPELSVREGGDKLELSWTPLEDLENDIWIYTVCYNKCNHLVVSSGIELVRWEDIKCLHTWRVHLCFLWSYCFRGVRTSLRKKCLCLWPTITAAVTTSGTVSRQANITHQFSATAAKLCPMASVQPIIFTLISPFIQCPTTRSAQVIQYKITNPSGFFFARCICRRSPGIGALHIMFFTG